MYRISPENAMKIFNENEDLEINEYKIWKKKISNPPHVGRFPLFLFTTASSSGGVDKCMDPWY